MFVMLTLAVQAECSNSTQPNSAAAVVLQTAEKGKAVASSEAFYAAEASDPVTDWQDYSNFYDEYDDDEEVRSCQCHSVTSNRITVLATSTMTQHQQAS